MENQELHDKLKALLDGTTKSLSSKLDTVNSGITILQTNQEAMISRLSKIEKRLADVEVKVSDIHLRTCELENA